MARIIDAFTQFSDDNGDPLVNGFLKFVESGTNNTDKNTYADINETIANANPVPLSAAGRCPNVFGTGSYNVISYTSDMVQIEQFDPVSGDQFEGAFSTWNSVTIYGIGDLVTGTDGLYYRSIPSNNQNQDPVSSPGQWEEVKFVGIWNTSISYSIGDVVYGSDGYLYRSLTNTNSGNNPTTDTINWGSSSIPEWITGASYSIGNLVFGSDGYLYSSNTDTNTGNDPISDATNWTNLVAQLGQIEGITATVATNALTCGLESTSLYFRDATLTDGIPNIRIVASPLSLVVPLDATLGTVNAIQSSLVLLAIDNAGTVELAIVNLSGGNDLSETGVISTTAIDATADSADVFYSTTARTNVAYRVVGLVESTQATAGTWATAPSLIQGAGGNALTSMNSLGYGQNWQTPTRVLGTTYYNTTGKPIFIHVAGIVTSNAQVTMDITVDGIQLRGSNGNTTGLTATNTAIIPPNVAYSAALSAGTVTTLFWRELR